MIQAILFDFDDTLVMTRHCKSDALKELSLLEFNRPLSNETIRKNWGKPYKEFIASMYGIHEEMVEPLLVKYRKVTKKYPMKAYPCAGDIIQRLSEDYLLGIITATSRYAIDNQMKELGFRARDFFFIQTADEISYHKPDPRVFDPVLEILGTDKKIEKREVLYVGDSLRDFFAARDAGIHFVGLEENTTSREEFARAGADTIKRLSLLPEYLHSV